MKKKLYIILGILFVLLPLGLLTEYSAWGEWDGDVYKKSIGFIPEGMKNATGVHPIIPDYGDGSVVMYYLSAIIGGMILFSIFYILAKMNKNETN